MEGMEPFDFIHGTSATLLDGRISGLCVGAIELMLHESRIVFFND
jgi:hypothetical protein